MPLAQQYANANEFRIYLANLTKVLKLQRFDSINYLPSVRECVKRRKSKYRKSTKSRDTIYKTKAVKMVDDRTKQKFLLRWRPRKLKKWYYENKFWYIDGNQTDFLSLRTLENEIYIKRFNKFTFAVVSFNLQNFVVFPIDWMAKFNRVLRESCCVVVAIFHVLHMLLFARFKSTFSFANIALVAVTPIYFVNGHLPVSRFNCILDRT